ncbi:serine hydrolase domain-containing protein [Flavobacterium microcysteis]
MNFKTLLLIAFLVISNQLSAQEKQSKIDELIKAYSQVNKFNGTALVVVRGEVVYKNAIGYSDAAAQKENNLNSIFPIGSLTKTFTSAMILKLAEEHKLSLQDSLTKYFPKFLPGKDITIEHLLTHTSGVYESLRNPSYRADTETDKKISTNEMMGYFIDQPLDFKPGTQFSYSNSGYNLLGVIIEKVTGLSYDKALEKYIFKKFNLKHTGFNYKALSNSNKTTGYSYLSPTRHIEAKPGNPMLLYSSGALYSTIGDLNKWYDVLKDNKFISQASFKKATQDHLGGYGYGWFIDSRYDKKIISHGGNVEGSTSCFIMEPENDISIILLNNITSTKLEQIGNSILAILLDKPYKLPKPKTAIQLDENTLSQYIGKYTISDDYIVSISNEEGQLYFQENQKAPIKIYAEKANYFFVNDDNLEIVFRKLEGNKMLEIKLSQGLSTRVGERT